MSNRAFYCNALTGGAANALDGINGSTCSNGDIAIVCTTNNVNSVYKLITPSTTTESSPLVITPDTNPGSKRWHIMKNYNGITLSKTSNYTITVQDVSAGVSRFNNSGSTKNIILSLPAGGTNYGAEFSVNSTWQLRVNANGTQKIRLYDVLTSSGGYVASSTKGTFWKMAWNGSEWQISSLIGELIYNT